MISENKVSRRDFRQITLRADLVVAGGGLAGVCSAIAAARQGCSVCLIQDRPVLGGNASSEVRLWALGATSHMGNNNRWSREGGITDEILVENVYRNKEGNPVIFDTVLIDKVLSEKNITLLLNTSLYGVSKDSDDRIVSVNAFNPQNGTEYVIQGQYFADCTGDGTLGYLAGASYRMGAENSGTYGELFAPDKEKYGELLGHSILFYMKDTGSPVRFVAPDFALKDAENHIPKLKNSQYFNIAQHGCKYWWLEYGGRLDTVCDTEQIKYELWKVVYGVWDYIKNSGKFPEAENLTLEWAGLFPGKRESRRFTGLYTLTQQDIIEQRRHYDAVAYGGWAIDLHPSDGVYADGSACNQWHSKGIYQIPYRCYVSADIDNLFIGGRIISTSHVANGSTRVMCTAALGGEVIGSAASVCLSNGILPKELALESNIGMLQSLLLSDGNFIPDADWLYENKSLHGAELKVSSEYRLESLAPSGEWMRLEYPVALLIPVDGKVPAIHVKCISESNTELTVELRSSSKKNNYTPDVTDAVCRIPLETGENDVTADFGFAYDSPRYVFICFRADRRIRIPLSNELVTGVTTVFNHINPAVSNFGRQDPPEGIGVESFEFWCPKRRPEGKNISVKFNPAIECFGADNLRNLYYRPYSRPNAWIPSPDDTFPELKISWKEEREIVSLKLFFDTDADHAMETVQMGHYDSVMPCCIRDIAVSCEKDGEIAHISGNYRSMNEISFDQSFKTRSLTIKFDNRQKYCRSGLMGIVVS